MKKVAAQFAVFTATAMTLITFILHWPCRNSGYIDGRFTSMCYSDVAAFVANPPLSIGNFPFGGADSLNLSPIPALLLWLIVKLTSDFTTLVVIAQLFLVVAYFVVAYATFYQRAWRPLDAAVVAAMPLWPMVMFVSLDVIGVAFASLALLYWLRQRSVVAGIFSGLALISGGWSWILLVAFVVDGFRNGQKRETYTAIGTSLFVSAMGSIPVLLSGSPIFNWSSAPGDGGILLIWRYALGNEPNLANIIATAGVLVVILVARWAYTLPFDFRLESLLLLFVLIQLVTSPGIPPQNLVRLAWLIPLVLAKRTSILTYAGVLIAYVMLVWLHLEGQVSGGKGAPDQAYALMSLIMVVTLCFMMYQVITIIKVQGQDPVRQAMARYINEKQHA